MAQRGQSQCKIIKNSTGDFLRDKSSNGTRVNGIKVGKDKTWPLRLIEQESVCILLNNLIGRDFPSFSWAMTDWIKWCKICQDAATRTFMVE